MVCVDTLRSFAAQYLPLPARFFTWPDKRIMRLALRSANLQATIISGLSVRIIAPIFKFGSGDRLNQRFSTPTYTRSTAGNFHMGSSGGKMSDQCNMKDSKDTASSQDTKVNSGQSKKELPKLTPAEFRVYNRLAEHMDYFVSIYNSRYLRRYLGREPDHKRLISSSTITFVTVGMSSTQPAATTNDHQASQSANSSTWACNSFHS